MEKEISFGIIGGTGGMGRLFESMLKERGYKVQIASRSTTTSIESCAVSNDVVIVTVPIASTINVIKRIGPLVRPDALLMDLTSLKTNEVQTMLDYASCEVIGCHPVFGPSVSSFEKQVIVLTPGRGEKWINVISELFTSFGAEVIQSTPEKHDQIMSIVQGLMHFTAITLVKTLMKTGFSEEELNKFSSPVYRIRTDFANRILNQNPELYADIELNNPQTTHVIESYIDACKNLLDIIKDHNRDAFIDTFKEASDYLGEYKSVAEKKTDMIIDYIAQLPK
jgi:prephenate dehydrogenase